MQVAARKRRSKVRPKSPARVRKRRTRRRPRGHQHPELVGLGIVVFGLFLGSVLYAGWNGGYVGKAIGDGFVAVAGGIAYVLPVACATVGGLIVARSDLPRFGPFRTGLAVSVPGLALVLGRAHGGYLGRGFEAAFGRLVGSTGVLLLGVFLLVAGCLLVTGASAGALLRRSGRAVRAAARKRPARRVARTARPGPRPEPEVGVLPAAAPPVDGVQEFPDVLAPAPLLLAQEREEEEEEDTQHDEQPSLFETAQTGGDAVYTLPDPGVLRRSKPVARGTAESSARVAEVLVQALSSFGVEARVVGEISGPRVTRYELQLAPGTKVAKVAALKDDLSYALATTEIRILAPIPGKQAVGVEVPNHSPNLVTLGDIYDELPPTSSPSRCGSGRTSPATRSGPIWPGCPTC